MLAYANKRFALRREEEQFERAMRAQRARDAKAMEEALRQQAREAKNREEKLAIEAQLETKRRQRIAREMVCFVRPSCGASCR